MKPYRVRCRLSDGERKTMTVIAESSCAAILVAIDTYGEALSVCSARPVGASHA